MFAEISKEMPTRREVERNIAQIGDEWICQICCSTSMIKSINYQKLVPVLVH